MFNTFISPSITYDSDAEKVARKLGVSVRKIHKELLIDVARFWHHRILPSHFTPGNETRYSMEPRGKRYKAFKARVGVGQGRYVSNVLSGQSFRWLMTTDTYTGTQSQATLRMKAPTYFTSPAIGTFKGKDGRSFTITRQPDKPKEVTQVNDADRSEMQKYMGRRYSELLNQIIGTSTAKAA